MTLKQKIVFPPWEYHFTFNLEHDNNKKIFKSHQIKFLSLLNYEKISKTTHSPHQFSQKLSKTPFIPSLFYIQVLHLDSRNLQMRE